jgi:imidazole glycerol phosphate synthase glutamine amidotransferase subunit
MKIAIISSVGGNFLRLSSFLEACGFDTMDCNTPQDLKDNEWIAIPGVTNTISQIRQLKSQKWIEYIRSANQQKIFAVCSGFQALGEQIEEHNKQEVGIGLIKDQVLQLPELKAPNIGWREVFSLDNHGSYGEFYFSHSDCYQNSAELSKNFDVLYSTDKGGNFFVAGLISERLIGLQFHPEVSGQNGKDFISKALKVIL